MLSIFHGRKPQVPPLFALGTLKLSEKVLGWQAKASSTLCPTCSAMCAATGAKPVRPSARGTTSRWNKAHP